MPPPVPACAGILARGGHYEPVGDPQEEVKVYPRAIWRMARPREATSQEA